VYHDDHFYLLIDKNLLIDGVSIGKGELCVKKKTTTKYRAAPDVMFWGLCRKLRDGNQEGDN